MANVERITATLPNDLVRDIDRRQKNRSKFVADAIRRELDFRRREELRRSLSHPHPDSASLSDGIGEWANALPTEDAGDLVDASLGKPVRWLPGVGWEEGLE